MRGRSFEDVIATVIAVVVVFGIFSLFIDNDPKCIRTGCNNDCESGSSYCYTHNWREHIYTPKNYNSGSSSSSSGSSSSSSSSGTTNYKSNSYSSGSMDSYDAGYEAISEDDDYDWDRYYSDSDYADGVDDAMEDYDW